MNRIDIEKEKCGGCDYELWCKKFKKSYHSRKRCTYREELKNEMD